MNSYKELKDLLKRGRTRNDIPFADLTRADKRLLNRYGYMLTDASKTGNYEEVRDSIVADLVNKIPELTDDTDNLLLKFIKLAERYYKYEDVKKTLYNDIKDVFQVNRFKSKVAGTIEEEFGPIGTSLYKFAGLALKSSFKGAAHVGRGIKNKFNKDSFNTENNIPNNIDDNTNEQPPQEGGVRRQRQVFDQGPIDSNVVSISDDAIESLNENLKPTFSLSEDSIRKLSRLMSSGGRDQDEEKQSIFSKIYDYFKGLFVAGGLFGKGGLASKGFAAFAGLFAAGGLFGKGGKLATGFSEIKKYFSKGGGFGKLLSDLKNDFKFRWNNTKNWFKLQQTKLIKSWNWVKNFYNNKILPNAKKVGEAATGLWNWLKNSKVGSFLKSTGSAIKTGAGKVAGAGKKAMSWISKVPGARLLGRVAGPVGAAMSAYELGSTANESFKTGRARIKEEDARTEAIRQQHRAERARSMAIINGDMSPAELDKILNKNHKEQKELTKEQSENLKKFLQKTDENGKATQKTLQEIAEYLKMQQRGVIPVPQQNLPVPPRLNNSSPITDQRDALRRRR